MKKLLILLFSLLILPFSVYASDVYYCSEDETIGFKPSNNYSSENYNPMKFKILIDFENNNVISDDIWFQKQYDQTCLFDIVDQSLYCVNILGSVFSINKMDSSFRRGSIYNKMSNQTDDIVLGYGTCEKF